MRLGRPARRARVSLVAGAAVILGLGAPLATRIAAAAPPVVDSAPVCAAAPAGVVGCFARVLRVDGAAVRHPDFVGGEAPGTAAAGSFTGLTPTQIRSAYGVTGTGAGQTVAVIDAYDNPSLTGSGSFTGGNPDNLAVYRHQFNLPACTAAGGCFSKVDENGGTNYPGSDAGWNLEEDLDVDAVSAVAPQAHILAVEMSGTGLSDVATAVATAVRLGATEVSMSFGGSEVGGDTVYDATMRRPGVFVAAAAGDSGHGTEYPAASPYVASVGGTLLTADSSPRGWSETVWGSSPTDGTGGGCSSVEPKAVWQTDTLCARRTMNDVAADADPNSGLATYDAGSWIVVGGTSLSTPLVAGMVAVGGGAGDSVGAQGLYAEAPSAFNDITSGSNGSCGTLCDAGTGFDSPTGWGSPAGAPVPLAFPSAVASASSLGFGSQTVGTTSAAQTVTVHATGGGDLHVSAVSVSGPFAVTADTCANATVPAAGPACSIHVDFQPAAVGAASGSLSIASDAVDGTQTVTLGGTGVGVPGATLPSSVAFGTVTTGQRVTRDVTVSSTGSGALTPSSWSTSGSPAFSVSGTTCVAGTPVASGSSCTITVAFAPTAVGPVSGTLSVADDAAGSPQSVALSGTGSALPAPAPQPPPPPPPPPPSPPATTGYWLAGADGSVYGFGSVPTFGGAHSFTAAITGIAGTPDHGGYWLAGADGSVYPYGDAGFFGSFAGHRLNQPVIGIFATATGQGYWLFAKDGGIFPFGDAGGYGSTGNIRLNKPAVGMGITADGRGYWIVCSDGGIFPFGDASGYGSTGNVRLNKPMVGMAVTASGRGYLLVASDGGLFPFGDAGGYGSTGNVVLNAPMVGMAETLDSLGYWLVARDGGIFPFGDAPGYGSTGGRRIPAPIVGMAAG